MTPKELAAGVAALVRKAVSDLAVPLTKRMEGVESLVAQIPAGRDGRDGTKGDAGDKGKDGRDGNDGRDGLGFEDLSVEYDGERAFSIKFMRGDRTKTFDFTLPLVIDRGFWRDGMEAKRGDSVTFGGSAWIAQTDTTAKPETGATDWRLAVKKGRDGKDGRVMS